MIAPKIVAEIRRLLEEDRHSQRRIARLMGVSRGSVAAIASGSRPDYETLRPRVAEPDAPSGPPERCLGCGGMVYLPCRLCLVRRKTMEASRLRGTGLASGTLRNRAAEIGELPAINLRPEHRARYELVRAEKQRQEREELGIRVWDLDVRGTPFVQPPIPNP